MDAKELEVGTLKVYTFENREELGLYAGKKAAARIKELQETPDKIVRMIFASAPSQQETLAYLREDEGIDWSRVVAFHMDEYVGIEKNHPQSFASFLEQNLFDQVNIGQVHFINGIAEDPQAECERYEALLKEAPIDIVCLGIGENAHIAFNEPHLADFADPHFVKLVDLDLTSRQQQVNDGCFLTLEEVPTHAITLTVPALFAGQSLYCMVPGSTKAAAVHATLNGEITTEIPSSILRTHPQVSLFIDKDSAAQLN